MRLKFLAVAAIVAISTLGLNLPAANAQPAQLAFGEGGDYVEPFIACRMWLGMTMLDKYSSAVGKSDSDLVIGYPGGGNEFGVRIRKGPILGEGKIDTCYTKNDEGPFETTFSTPGVNVKYFVNDDLTVHFGSGGDLLNMPGDNPPVVSPGDDGFRGFTCAPGGMMVDASYKGFAVGIMNEGHFAMSQYAPSDASNFPGTTNATDYTIPRVGVAYNYGAGPDPLQFNAFFVYQTKKIDDEFYDHDGDETTAEIDNPLHGKAIVSYATGAKVKANMGPLALHIHGYYCANAGEMGAGGNCVELKTGSTDEFSDTVEMGGNFTIAYNMGAFEPAAGAAYKVVSNDNWDKDDPTMAYFVRVKFPLAPGLSVHPGVIITDNMKNSADADEGKVTKAGVFLEAMF